MFVRNSYTYARVLGSSGSAIDLGETYDGFVATTAISNEVTFTLSQDGNTARTVVFPAIPSGVFVPLVFWKVECDTAADGNKLIIFN
tara:strand:+ start:137 stop:397 length:261 start_codon:yes stop_codon:yes gene_type:complete